MLSPLASFPSQLNHIGAANRSGIRTPKLESNVSYSSWTKSLLNYTIPSLGPVAIIVLVDASDHGSLGARWLYPSGLAVVLDKNEPRLIQFGQD